MKTQHRGIKVRAKYVFDNYMSKGGFSVFMALILLFVGAIVLMAAFRFVANLIAPQESTKDLFTQWWLSFLQIADGGSIAEDTGSNALNRVVGIISLFVGMVLFSSLVAFITSLFEAKLDELRKGKSQVIESGHALILGFGDRVLEIIRELVIANESEKNPAVVVLSEREKDEMDDYFRDRIETRKNTRIITRSGSTSSMQLLRRVGVGSAKSVIILNDSSVADSDEDKERADARVLKTIMAVIACTGEKDAPPIVAELQVENKRRLAKSLFSNIAVINEHSILARLMVQTSRTSGLAQVYDNLVGFEGSEFYFHKPNQGFGGKSYGEILFQYDTCSVLGMRRRDGTVTVNPHSSTRFEAGDEVIVLAEDDSLIRYQLQARTVQVPDGTPVAALAKAVENQLIVGWSKKTATIVEEYSNYLVKGSSISVAVKNGDDVDKAEFAQIQGRHSAIKLRLLKLDIHQDEHMRKLKPEGFDNIIILTADGGDAETRDSETIAALLEFRHYFRTLGRKDIKTQLITEVADSENIEVIQEVGVNDFMISNQFVSKIYAQVSENPEVLKVYEDLFDPEGSEVYIKPLSLYLQTVPESISFAELCAAALKRGETCFGIRFGAATMEEGAVNGNVINPAKNRRFRLAKDDMLIVLAEDES